MESSDSLITTPSVKEKVFEIVLVLLSLPFPLVTLILGVIRFIQDRYWMDIVNGEKALPSNFPCKYFRGRTFRLMKDEFPQDEMYSALLPSIGTDVYIITLTTLYILVSIGVLVYLCVTTNPIRVIRNWVLLWAVGGCTVALSLLVTAAATTTQTTINNQESYQKVVQSIRIFEADNYGVTISGQLGFEDRPVEMSLKNLRKSIKPVQAFRLREQCQALITIFQYCGAIEVDASIDSPSFVVRNEKCKASDMTEAGFCPSRSYFDIFISFLVWTILHVLGVWIIIYLKFQADRESSIEEDIPVFHEAQEAQGSEDYLSHSHNKRNEIQPYYAPSHPDQYDRLKKYNQMFLRDFNK